MLTIRDDDKTDNLVYGGKANSLLKLSRNNINVPRFFVVTSELFAKFLQANSLMSVIAAEDKNTIQSAIGGGSFPDNLANEIYRTFDDYHFQLVSCRSSAVNEDGVEKSFAGQYESYLNVSRDNLLDAIKKCWQSLYEDNVSAYSGERANDGMNVIVQAMVAADYAGVAFSLDPTAHTKNYSVTEVVRGLGESLVSGAATPSRFVIRRETLHADLKTGDIDLSDEIIASLEKIFLQIEKLYQTPVDIEWAIHGAEIFILQTRPITAFNAARLPFVKIISRERSVAELQLYQAGEVVGIKNLTRGLYYFKSLAIYRSDKKLVDLYYNNLNLEEHPASMYYYMDLDFAKTENALREAEKSVAELVDLIDNNRAIDLATFVKNVTNIQPFSSLGELVGTGRFFATDRLKKLLTDFRENYGDILYKANGYLNTKVREILPTDYKNFANFVELYEAFAGELPEISELQKRTRGYVLFEGKLEVYGNLDEALTAKNITVETTITGNEKTLHGAMAYGGKISGHVKKIFSSDEFAKFADGDILVTTMTTPKFTPILDKARAIVTDEGGMTCHAAIIAREMKIPTVVGTGNATEILNDGDEVEIDADEGIVKIL